MPESPAAPRGQDRGRGPHWNRHWPLPVSLVLAIVYWLYLNQQVSRTVPAEVDVHIASTGMVDRDGKVLHIRPPSRDYMITELRDASDKPFVPEKDKVRFKITAPGGYLRRIDTSLALIVDVDVRQEDSLDQGQVVWKFTKDHVKDATGELTSFIRAGEMNPPEITVYLRRKDSVHLELRPEHVVITYPEDGGWANRVFQESVAFDPEYVTLTGPKAELDELGDQRNIFLLDLSKKLERVSGRPGQQQVVVQELRLREQFAAKGIRIARDVRATVPVAPPPTVIDDLRVKVIPVWENAGLNRADFKVDEEVKVRLHSFNKDLSKRLSVRAEAERWARDNLFCIVKIAEIDPSLDHTKSDFKAHPQPYWTSTDPDFRIDRDIRILQLGLISLTRKVP